MIQTLEPYMPEKKALQALKEEPLSLSLMICRPTG